MKTSTVQSSIGILDFGEDGKLVDAIPLPKDATKIAERSENIENGKIVDELIALLGSIETNATYPLSLRDPRSPAISMKG